MLYFKSFFIGAAGFIVLKISWNWLNNSKWFTYLKFSFLSEFIGELEQKNTWSYFNNSSISPHQMSMENLWSIQSLCRTTKWLFGFGSKYIKKVNRILRLEFPNMMLNFFSSFCRPIQGSLGDFYLKFITVIDVLVYGKCFVSQFWFIKCVRNFAGKDSEMV